MAAPKAFPGIVRRAPRWGAALACALCWSGAHSQSAPTPAQPAGAAPAQAFGTNPQVDPLNPLTPAATTNPSTLLVPSITTSVTRTSNSYFGASLGLTPHADTLINVAPELLVKSIGSAVQIDGDIAFNGLYSVDHTQVDHIAPRGSIDVVAQFVPHTLFLDAGATATQSLNNPFLGQSGSPSTFNTYTTEQYHLSPYVSRELAPDLTLLMRSDNFETNYSGAADQAALIDSYSRNDIVRLSQKPVPFGWVAELTDSETRFNGDSNPALKNDAARLEGELAVAPEWEVGIIGGYERTEVADGDVDHSIVGLSTSWVPSTHTRLDATIERRFFGDGWNLQFSRRDSQTAVTALWTRSITSYPQTLLSGPAGTSVPGLIEAILTTLYPNPIERAQAADNILNLAGLPKSLSGSTTVYTEEALLESAASATFLLLDTRNTASFTIFQSHTQVLQVGAPLVPLLASSGVENQQFGVALVDGYRLTPVSAISVTVSDRTVESLESIDALNSRLKELQFEYTRQLAARTSLSLTLQRQLLTSNAVGNSNQTALIVSLTHRF